MLTADGLSSAVSLIEKQDSTLLYQHIASAALKTGKDHTPLQLCCWEAIGINQTNKTTVVRSAIEWSQPRAPNLNPHV